MGLATNVRFRKRDIRIVQGPPEKGGQSLEDLCRSGIPRVTLVRLCRD